MTTRIRHFLVLFSVLLLSSCVAISTANITEIDRLDKDEGVIITRTQGTNLELVGQSLVHDKDDTGIGFPLGRIGVSKESQLIMIKVKARKNTYLSSFASYGGKAYFGKDDFNFTVQPGTVTYIGDIAAHEKFKSVTIVMEDNEASTMAMAKKAAPWLFSKYAYKKSIASNR